MPPKQNIRGRKRTTKKSLPPRKKTKTTIDVLYDRESTVSADVSVKTRVQTSAAQSNCSSLVNTKQNDENSNEGSCSADIATIPESYSAPSGITKAAENFLRLCNVITTVCSDLFRDILSRHVQPGNLRRELDRNKNTLLKFLKNHQNWRILYPPSGGKSLSAKDMDLSLLYTLLRNICGIPSHQTGWGKHPNPSDKSLAACIERIREQRNEIAGHPNIGEVDDTRFRDVWKKLRDDIVNIERILIGGNMYERTVDYSLTIDLSSSKIEEMKQLVKGILHAERLPAIQQYTRIRDERKALQRVQISMTRNIRGTVSSIEEKIEGRFSALEDKIEERFSAIDEQIKDIKSHYNLVPMLTIDISGTLGIEHISILSSDALWINNDNTICQVDSSENIIGTIDIVHDDRTRYCGSHTVSMDGDLVFISLSRNTPPDAIGDSYAVYKRSTDGNITTLLTTSSTPKCIYSSHINGDILIGMTDHPLGSAKALLMRCDRIGRKIQDIELDNEGRRLFEDPQYMTENQNGDVVVSDEMQCALVVVDRLGRHRFNYTGHFTDRCYPFFPKGVCTDLLGRILVIHSDDSDAPEDDENDAIICRVSLLDKNGHFLARILSEPGDNLLASMCVNDQNNILVAYYDKIKVFKL